MSNENEGELEAEEIVVTAPRVLQDGGGGWNSDDWSNFGFWVYALEQSVGASGLLGLEGLPDVMDLSFIDRHFFNFCRSMQH